MDDAKTTLLEQLFRNRRLAHDVLFKHRHPNATPNFHYEAIDIIHSDVSNFLLMAFRGGAKSTLQEESAIIEACYRLFKNRVVLGASFERASDRLKAIKHEFETNEMISALFGDMVGGTWNEDKIVLANGTCIQAYGVEQSFRGVKHLDQRPDRMDLDDIETEEWIKTPQARQYLFSKFMKVYIPGCDPNVRVRMYATPLDPQALPMRLIKSSDWASRVYPIYYINPLTGDRVSAWPDRFSVEWIEAKEASFRKLGAMQEWAQEYLCQPEDPSTKAFTADMLKVKPRVRTWEPTFVTYDPARSTKATSAHTGKAVFSWINNRLVVWEGSGNFWMPDQIIDDIFATDDMFQPVEIGIEVTGLVEFIEQPLRQQQTLRQHPLVWRKLTPPRDKLSFIRSLQPFFSSNEVEWASEMSSEAREQLLAFPTGRIDFPNALAYALIMRPGQPVYEGFSRANVHEDLELTGRDPLWLVCNATPAYTAAALVQVVRGSVHVVADWLHEGGPGESLAGIVKVAALEAGRAFKLVVPTVHFGAYDLVGLRPAAAKIPVMLRQGGGLTEGREEIRKLLTMQVRGVAMLLVSTAARWTLNALAGGYARAIERSGKTSDEPVDGPYRILMEGLESFAALMNSAIADASDNVRYATSPDGRRYITSIGGQEATRPTKDAWLQVDDNVAGERTLRMRR